MTNLPRDLGAVVFFASFLGLAACSSGSGDTTPVVTTQSDSSHTEVTDASSGTTADQSADQTLITSGVIPGEVGKLHGLDCASLENCSVSFTIEKLDIIEKCPGEGRWEPTEGQALLEFQALVEVSAEPVRPGYDAGYFATFSDWSALTDEGVNVPIESDTICMAQTDARQGWHEPVYPGDKQRAHQYFSIPTDSAKLRLTESDAGTRWEFDLP